MWTRSIQDVWPEQLKEWNYNQLRWRKSENKAVFKGWEGRSGAQDMSRLKCILDIKRGKWIYIRV